MLSASEVNEQAKPQRKHCVDEKQISGETVLYDNCQQKVYSINPIAAAIWQLCDGQRNVRNIAEELAAGYGKDVGEVLDDVKQLIAEVAKLDLLHLQED